MEQHIAVVSVMYGNNQPMHFDASTLSWSPPRTRKEVRCNTGPSTLWRTVASPVGFCITITLSGTLEVGVHVLSYKLATTAILLEKWISDEKSEDFSPERFRHPRQWQWPEKKLCAREGVTQTGWQEKGISVISPKSSLGELIHEENIDPKIKIIDQARKSCRKSIA